MLLLLLFIVVCAHTQSSRIVACAPRYCYTRPRRRFMNDRLFAAVMYKRDIIIADARPEKTMERQRDNNVIPAAARLA